MCIANKAPEKSSFHSLAFAFMYDSLMEKFESHVLKPRRKKLLSSLSGNILEIGSGTGVNFTFYGPEANVLAIEPSLAMLRQSQKRYITGKIQANIQVLHAGVGDNFPIPQDGFSTVVCTLVLCTIPEIKAAIETIKTVLQKNGRLMILEHIVSKNTLTRNIQNIFTPLWKILAGDCHLNRDTAEILFEMGFRPQHESYFSYGLTFYQASGTFELNDALLGSTVDKQYCFNACSVT